jgi:glycosyltransferase involved in cell wall biosynthesis
MEIAGAFQAHGWRVQVISVFDAKEFERTEGIQVAALCPRGHLQRALWSRFLWKFVAAWYLRRALAEGGLLLCAHAHLLPALDYAPQRPNVCLWGWVYGLDVWGEQARRWVPLLNRLDRVVSISAFTAAEVVSAGLTQPVNVVPCCVDTEVFIPTPMPKLIRRNEILICGRMAVSEKYKGHQVLFQSLPMAERLLGRALSIRVVGTGDDHSRLQQQAQTLGIGARVHFVGRVSMQDLVEAYQHCGVFCMPSRVDRPDRGHWTGEGFGIVYVEAAACGRPVIASAEGGAPETILPGQTGLLVDPRSPERVAKAIADVLSDSGRADEMGRQGRLLAVSRFSREHFFRRLQELAMADGFCV